VNAKYLEGRVAFARGDVGDVETADLVLVALTSAYVFDEAHDATDIDSAVLGGVALTEVTVDEGGRIHSDPAVFSFSLGDDIAYLVLRVDDGPLLGFYDTLTGDQPIDIPGDGTDKTVHPPLEGWYWV
jgi:hypothetical protein